MIQVGYRVQVVKTPTYPAVCPFRLFVALYDHNPPTLQKKRERDRQTDVMLVIREDILHVALKPGSISLSFHPIKSLLLSPLSVQKYFANLFSEVRERNQLISENGFVDTSSGDLLIALILWLCAEFNGL